MDKPKTTVNSSKPAKTIYHTSYTSQAEPLIQAESLYDWTPLLTTCTSDVEHISIDSCVKKGITSFALGNNALPAV